MLRTDGGWSRPVAPRERAVLAHPDRRSPWLIVLDAHLHAPLDDPTGRLDALASTAPIVGARLAGDGRTWRAGPAPSPSSLPATGDRDAGRLVPAGLLGALDLNREPPLRVAVDPTGTRVVLAGHHAAFDGLGLATVLASLLDTPLESAPARRRDQPASAAGTARGPSDPGRGGSGLAAAAGSVAGPLARLRRPADRVAPSHPRPATESLTVRDATVPAPRVTARLAGATVDAVAAWNAARRAPARRIGVSLGIGGDAVVGNTASYRRVDVATDETAPRNDAAPFGAAVEALVDAAIRSTDEPAELSVAPRFARPLLRPVVHRFSDTVLVSNLGVIDLPGVRRLAFFPVARGRSAVAVGAVSLERGSTTLALRARDLALADATDLLAAIARTFERPVP